MSKKQTDGTTLRDHLNVVWGATGLKPKELEEEPQVPRGCMGILEVFYELNSTRGSAGMGVSPITFHDIIAWQTVVGVTLTPFELRCIFGMDSAALSEMNK